jgi:hypothetical protein
LGCWPPKENNTPNHISGTFAATCSLMQIARDVSSAVYVRPRSVFLDFEFLMVNHSSDFSRLSDHLEAHEFRIAEME